MASFVCVNHKVAKTMAKPVMMVTRNYSTMETSIIIGSWWLDQHNTTVNTIKCEDHSFLNGEGMHRLLITTWPEIIQKLHH